MRKLKEKINKNGFNYILIDRNDFAAIYSQHDPANNGRIVGLEVFKIKVKPPDMFIDEPREAFPGNEDFGAWAWSFGVCSDPSRTVSRAWAKYAEISERGLLETTIDGEVV